MNWGWGIVVVFALFICMMLYFFLRAMTVDLNMVRADYYQEETEINDSKEKRTNYNSLGKELLLSLDDNSKILTISFPTTVDTGLVWIYRPSSSRLDQKYGIPSVQDSTLNLMVRPLSSGFWRIKISWSEKGTEFFTEETLRVE